MYLYLQSVIDVTFHVCHKFGSNHVYYLMAFGGAR